MIAPTSQFNSSLYLNYSNFTQDCPETDLGNCTQCGIIMTYDQQTNVCAVCPEGKFINNSIPHKTMFYPNNRTEAHYITISCQTGNSCNSIENNQQVRYKLATSFNFAKFFNSIASIPKLTILILLSILFISLFHQI